LRQDWPLTVIMADENHILAIIGPTASGKSSLAIAVARRLRCDILSVDSMQVYQAMNIGTAKASLAEQFEIHHHLLDWVRPDELFSAARFIELADRVIADCRQHNIKLIATGGTPMYFKALFHGLFAGPSADEGLRDKLKAMDGQQLHQRLAEVDPVAAARIHLQDQKRLVRALEVYELSGQPISQLQQQWSAEHPQRHKAIWIGLAWDKDELNPRINARVKDMLAAGWLDEVRMLLSRYPSISKTAAEATGYRELIDYLTGRTSLEEAVEQIKIATRQLARKQMKWFRRFPNVHWLAGNAPLEANVAAAIELWNRGNGE